MGIDEVISLETFQRDWSNMKHRTVLNSTLKDQMRTKFDLCNANHAFLTYLSLMFHFYSPENVRKPKVFWRFKGV